jgi:hypothetical protein
VSDTATEPLAPSMPPWTRPANDPWILAQLEIERQAVVEPWQPKLGDRVMVRLNGECPYYHDKEEDRQIGVVDSLCTQAELDLEQPTDGDRCTIDHGHFYGVHFDHPVSWAERVFKMTWGTTLCAAAELVLVERAS